MTHEATPGGRAAAQVAVADATPSYDKLYTYLVPTRLEGHIFVGGMVLAPFGQGAGRPRVGVVMALEHLEAPGPRLKELWDAAPEETALSDELMGLVRVLKDTTFCTWFEAVRAVLPRGAQYKIKRGADGWRLEKQLARADEVVYELAVADGEIPEGARKPTAKQQSVLDLLRGGAKSRSEICDACGVGPSVADNLAEKGWLTVGKRPRESAPDPLLLGDAVDAPADYELTKAQQEVVDALTAEMEAEHPKPALLHGVTGSGKTPVFIHLARRALAQGKTALVLVPEIGLTPQMMGTLRAAFGGRVAVLHSGLSDTERLGQWRAIQSGEAPVVVGTRSAVFAPLENIGLIVVDEEQERSYQSETAPRYDAVEIARRRSAHHGALALLASATPSVASYYMAKQGHYALYTLAQRYGKMPLPAVEMVDMGAELLAGNAGVVSRALAQGIRETVAGGGQVILLLNRRGYHRVALCRDCGKSVKCEDCSAPMVLHRARGVRYAESEAEDRGPDGYLMCHHCGKSIDPAPALCPECGGALRYAGFGTQRLEDELAEILPGAQVLRMDMDTTQRKGSHAAMLLRFAAGEYDILLGTQMVAKGLDFERVKLVGVIGIDSLLFNQSYRAYEHVFSLVTQVVGRSGRAGSGPAAGVHPAVGQGRAMIQTVDPGNPVLTLAAKQDYEAFYAEEIGFRKLNLYPPFCALCVAGFSAADSAVALSGARRFAAMLAARAGASPGIPLRVLGPVPMQVAQVAGKYRYRLTLKCRNDAKFRVLVRQVLDDYNGEGWPRKVTTWLDFHSEG